jgi:hypothetical protein
LTAQYGRPIAIAASGKMTTPAIIAAAIAEKCSSLYLTAGLQSFSSLILEEQPAEPFANWIPNSVPGQDLEGLLKKLSPRPVRRGAWIASDIAAAFSSIT